MLSDEEFRRLLDHLDRPWDGFRKVRKGVKKRLQQHMQSLGCRDVEHYLHRIQNDESAKDECEALLLVTISRFFRDHVLWDHLRCRVLPELNDRFPGGLNAWSAGCANGEEPYTLAMLWKDLSARVPAPAPLRILATDANPVCLQRADNGQYPASSLKEVPEHYKTRWFATVRGGRQFQVDPSLKDLITWQHHHLMDPPPPGPFQIILMRNNLLTYYQGTNVFLVLIRILSTLSIPGVLILGSHEHLPFSNLPLQRDATCPWIYHALPRP